MWCVMIDLNLDVRIIKGIGNKSLMYLNEASIYTIKDLLFKLPKKYNIYEIKSINSIEDEELATVKAVVDSNIIVRTVRKSIDNVIFYARINGIKIKIIAFGKRYLRYTIKPGSIILIYGIYKKFKKEFMAREIFTNELPSFVSPVYGIKNISNGMYSKYVASIINEVDIKDDIPNELLEKYRLDDINTFLRKAHFPQNSKDVLQVTRRSKYEMYLKYLLELESLRYFVNNNKKNPKYIDKHIILDFVKNLPYELTNSQKATINDIVSDSKKDIVMNRLVQGDVGSGKTIVATTAILLNATLGYQSILMAPTEILANQHFNNILSLLSGYSINIQLLTSSTPNNKKEEIIKKLEAGIIDVLISTHSVLYHKIRYFNLGLFIVDEQHRFGVNARQELLNQFPHTDAMYLSATPIPRTLGLTKFADMDISSMTDRPLNRKKVETIVISVNELDQVYDDIRKRINRNEQVFCVCSLIDNDDEYDLKYVKGLLEDNISNIRVGVVHGGLNSEQKRTIMLDFFNKRYDALVSTTVIEVGIDIKAATGIYIFNAERFGLATLHQLRGRVGRNELNSVCYLITNKTDTDRLNFLASTDDCFQIAEYDLNDRGPGEILGEAQSGFSGFDIKSDFNIYKCAKSDASMCFDRYLEGKLESLGLIKIIEKMLSKKAKLN